MSVLIIISLIVVFIAAISTGVVRRCNQHRASLLLTGVIPLWWPEKSLKVVGVLQQVFFWGSIVLVVISFIQQVIHLNFALVVMFIMLSIFLWLIGFFLGGFFSTEVLRNYAKKQGVDLPQECI